MDNGKKAVYFTECYVFFYEAWDAFSGRIFIESRLTLSCKDLLYTRDYVSDSTNRLCCHITCDTSVNANTSTVSTCIESNTCYTYFQQFIYLLYDLQAISVADILAFYLLMWTWIFRGSCCNLQRQYILTELHVCDCFMQVFEGHNLETPNTFYVQGQQKSIELHTRFAALIRSSLFWQVHIYVIDFICIQHFAVELTCLLVQKTLK